MPSNRGKGRNVQAFEALFEPDDDTVAQAKGGKGSKQSSGKRRGDERIPLHGFRLREADSPQRAGGSSGPAAQTDEAQLSELFGSSLPADLISDVYSACNRDLAAATEALLGISSSSGGEGSSSSAHPIAAEPMPAPEPTGPCYWDYLPQQCKEQVLGLLTLRELAQAARACREWAAHVRHQRSGLRAVRVPRDVTHSTLRGLVAAFSNATEVDLSRWRDVLKFPHNFEAAFTAIALGESDRPTGMPVSRLSLARCRALTNVDVASLLESLPHLERLDLSYCHLITDAALGDLARYSRQAGRDDGPDAQQQWEKQQEEENVYGAKEAADQQLARLALEGDGSTANGAGRSTGPSHQNGAALESPRAAVSRIAAQLRSRQAAAAAVRRAQLATQAGFSELVLRGASITGRGLKALLQPGSATAKSLQVLDVTGCPNLGPHALDVPPQAALRVLRAGACNALRSVAIQLPDSSPLEELCLDNCRQLQEVVVVAPRLRSLSVSHCGVLRMLGLRCRSLAELQAVNCGALNLGAFGALFDCPRLRMLNLFGCRSLNVEGMEAAASSLQSLVSLELSGCIALSRLQLPQAPALQRVAVNGCAVLRVVSLAAPQLAELRAKGCTRLMEVRLFSSVLSVLDLENCTNVREVALLDLPAAAPAGTADAQAVAQPAGAAEHSSKAELVLRGCTALPPEVQHRLRAAVLRSG